jgi:glycosyltransferase involved in cell wall biosynthesis
MYTVESATDQITAVSGGQPKVAILMGTYNGERFLKQQLDSIAAQSHSYWELYVSDDGSTDNTLAILDATTINWPNPTSVRKGPHKGFAANFLSLACDSSIKSDYFAFSDQDDIWDCKKLARALHWLESIPQYIPAMYCSRTLLINEKDEKIGLSPLFKRKPTFQNALVQSIAGANTMVFNKAARNLLLIAGHETPIVSHDWWIYLVVTGCDGKVFYDSYPSLGYRQHHQNLVGSNVGWRARYRRIVASFRGRFAMWNDINFNALIRLNSFLSKENKAALNQFAQIRQNHWILRVLGILRSGLYRQTLLGNMSLLAAAALGKI